MISATIETLAPGFLVASPALREPNFDHTVVLLCVHDKDGSMGLVINRPAPVTLADILQQMGIDCLGDGSQAALVGGPVSLESGLLLYDVPVGTPDRPDELQITETLRLCPNQDVLKAIGRNEGPSPYQIFLGHAGWGPGQLEQEVAQGAWIPASLHKELIFEVPLARRWEAALASEGLNPAQVSGFRPAN